MLCMHAACCLSAKHPNSPASRAQNSSPFWLNGASNVLTRWLNLSAIWPGPKGQSNSPPSTVSSSRCLILHCMRSRYIAPKKNPSLRRFPAWSYCSIRTTCGLRARKLCPLVFVHLVLICRMFPGIVPGASVGRLAVGERSVSTVKRLAERRKERSDRSQPLNGSVAQLRRPQAGTDARGAKWSQGSQGAITARSVRWFRRVPVAELHIKRLIPDRLVDSIIKSQPPQLPQTRSKRQNNWRSKT